MNIETKQINITVLFEEEVLSVAQTKTSDIRNKVIELWDDLPVVTQFPELIALIVPKEQINITIQDKTLIIANQNIQPFDGRNIEKFLQLVRSVIEILSKPISAYGYNYHFQLAVEKEEAIAVTNILKNIVSFEKLKIDPDKVIGSGINFSYMEHDNRKQIVITPNFATDLKTLSSVVFSCNIHFFEGNLPEYSKLSESFKSEHSTILSFVKDILNNN